MKQGIRLELSAPYTPEENGKVKLNWRTITPMARCVIKQSGLDKTYWPYAINMSSDIKTSVNIRGSKEYHSKQCMDKSQI